MERISDRIMFMPPDHSLDRPLLGYIKGSNLAVAVDAGSSSAHVSLFYSELEKSGLPLPALTVLTHSHWDHSFGLSAIQGLSIANCATYGHLVDDMNASREVLFHSYISEEYSFLRKEYPSPDSIIISLPDISFRDHLMIDAGGLAVELFQVPSPHTDDGTLVFIPSEGVLFIGDASSGEILSDKDLESGGRYEKRALEAFISALKDIGAETVIHSHAEPVSAAEEISYLEGILAEL